MPGTASESGRRRRRWLGPLRPLLRIRWSVRLRLTLLYGALFLVSGAALLGITYLLVAGSPASMDDAVVYRKVGSDDLPDLDLGQYRGQIEHVLTEQHAAELRWLLAESGVALAVMTVVSVALGWVMAGRVLRPVRIMSDKARRISARNLHDRLAVAGPADELKDLGDTFDGLLERLDAAFEAQKRFVANASHELRTPLTFQHAVVEVALADPDADARSLRSVCERVLAAGEGQERLIEALLTLASSQRGLDQREPLDLAEVAAAVLSDRRPERSNGVRLESALAPAETYGDARLVERLAMNLVENALRYNTPAGWVRVSTGTGDGGQPVLRVANSGPVIPPDRIPVLFQPFQRLESRTGSPDGHGLGLSIVAAIANAHEAQITAAPGGEGGLAITIAFPALGRQWNA